jgi:hypothetical protein
MDFLVGVLQFFSDVRDVSPDVLGVSPDMVVTEFHRHNRQKTSGFQ